MIDRLDKVLSLLNDPRKRNSFITGLVLGFLAAGYTGYFLGGVVASKDYSEVRGQLTESNAKLIGSATQLQTANSKVEESKAKLDDTQLKLTAAEDAASKSLVEVSDLKKKIAELEGSPPGMWPALSDSEISALAAALKMIKPTEVRIYCNSPVCRPLQDSFMKALSHGSDSRLTVI